MKVKMVLIGMAAGLLLPLAAGSAAAVSDPGLGQAGERAPTAENFWLDDHDCDKSPSRFHECKHRMCDSDDEKHGRMKHDKDGEWEDHGGRCDRDDRHRWCDNDDHGKHRLKHDKD